MILQASDLATHEGLIAFQTVCLEHDACTPAMDWIAYSITQGWSLRECMDRAPGDRSAWAEWCRTVLAETMDEDVRFVFGTIAAEAGARVAAQLCYDRDDMGLDEAITLLGEWHSAMREDGQVIFPTIENELARKAT